MLDYLPCRAEPRACIGPGRLIFFFFFIYTYYIECDLFNKSIYLILNLDCFQIKILALPLPFFLFC